MKTERVTLLASPEFKAFLFEEALREGVSVSELIRTRCERASSEDETELAELAALAAAVLEGVHRARVAARDGIARAEKALAEIRAGREQRERLAEVAK